MIELAQTDVTTSCCSSPSEVKAGELNRLKDSPEEIKQQVQARYAQSAEKGSGCGCSTENPFNLDSYTAIDGYEIEADLGLGCGIPTEEADIQEGQHVLDLGSGAGVDAFVARRIVGASGQVTGVDFTPQMVELAKRNAKKLGYENVSFVQGDIENLPIPSDSVDRVISNCVLNLVPNKAKAFAEMHRVLSPGGRFTVSDIVLEGNLPESILKTAEAYAGCVSGAIPYAAYIGLLEETGFSDVKAVKENELTFSDEDLLSYATKEDIAEFRNSTARVVSITVTGSKEG